MENLEYMDRSILAVEVYVDNELKRALIPYAKKQELSPILTSSSDYAITLSPNSLLSWDLPYDASSENNYSISFSGGTESNPSNSIGYSFSLKLKSKIDNPRISFAGANGLTITDFVTDDSEIWNITKDIEYIYIFVLIEAQSGKMMVARKILDKNGAL